MQMPPYRSIHILNMLICATYAQTKAYTKMVHNYKEVFCLCFLLSQPARPTWTQGCGLAGPLCNMCPVVLWQWWAYVCLWLYGCGQMCLEFRQGFGNVFLDLLVGEYVTCRTKFIIGRRFVVKIGICSQHCTTFRFVHFMYVEGIVSASFRD